MKLDKKKLLAVIAVLLLIAGLIVAYFWYQGSYYVSTIDARVNARMANVTPPVSGKLVTFTGTAGQQVIRDEKLGTVDGGTMVGSLNAPITGTLVKVNVNEGQAVSAGQTAAVVADMNSLYISANIEETEISKCKVGQGVDIRLDAYPNQVFYGRIKTISEAANSVFSTMSSSNSNGNYTKITQLIPIEIQFAESTGSILSDLKVGMNAEIRIHVKKGLFGEGAMEQALGTEANGVTNTTGKANAFSDSVLTGILAPAESYSVTASVGGRVQEVASNNGASVSTGTVLLKQDPTDVQLQSGQGGNSSELVLRLKAAYDLAEETYQKNQTLYASGAIPEMTLAQSKTQRDSALLQYQGTANLVNEQTAKTIIKSPGTGIVTNLNLKAGDALSAGAPVATIVDLTSVVLTVNVPETWLDRVALGNKVPVTIMSLNKTVEGTITFASPVAAGSGQLFPVKITIPNADGTLKAGMACTAQL